MNDIKDTTAIDFFTIHLLIENRQKDYVERNFSSQGCLEASLP